MSVNFDMVGDMRNNSITQKTLTGKTVKKCIDNNFMFFVPKKKNNFMFKYKRNIYESRKKNIQKFFGTKSENILEVALVMAYNGPTFCRSKWA